MPTEENEEFENMTTDEAVELMYAKLPDQVQKFLVSKERGAVALDLASKYALHVDQAGEFERAFIFMLLGVNTPEEFVDSLRKAGLPPEVVSGLATDLNERVFMRLRESERDAARAPEPASKSTPLPPPALEYEPAPTLPGSPEKAPMRVVGTPTQAFSVPAVPPADPTPQQQVIHAMPNAAQPGWHPAAAVHIFVPTHGAHMQPAQTATAPVPVAEVPEAPTPVVAVPVERGYANPEPAPQTPQTPITKAYVADPYREPTE